MDQEQAKRIGEGFVELLETNRVRDDVFAADVFCDINVPSWRFQLQGKQAVEAWLAGEQPDGSRVTSWRADPMPDGVVVQTDQEVTEAGEVISSRQLHRIEVREGRIVEWAMYCTGTWDAATRERQAREAPMLRP